MSPSLKKRYSWQMSPSLKKRYRVHGFNVEHVTYFSNYKKAIESAKLLPGSEADLYDRTLGKILYRRRGGLEMVNITPRIARLLARMEGNA